MPIPVKLSKEQYDASPDFLKEGYTESADGNYELAEIPGLTSKAKLDEFRDNNKALMSQLDELKTQAELYKDVNLEEMKALKEQQRQIEEKELIKAGDIDQIVAARIKEPLEARDTTISELDQKFKAANSKLSELMIDNTTTALATALGVEPTALMDVAGRARQQFSVVDNKVVALDGDGKTVYGSDGITPLSLDKTWMEGLKQNAPHLFRQPSGTGAGDGSGTRRPSGDDLSQMSVQQKITEGLAARETA